MQKFDLRCSQCGGVGGGVSCFWVCMVAPVLPWLTCEWLTWRCRLLMWVFVGVLLEALQLTHAAADTQLLHTKDEDIPLLTSLKIKNIAEI